jgi:hypothetical protein
MHYLSVDEYCNLLEGSGFDDVDVVVKYDEGWICATARKAT